MTERRYPPRGHFEWQTLVGAWDGEPAGGSHFERFWDIHVDGSYPLGTFRDADGVVYSCVRRVANAGDSLGLVLQTNADGQALRIHPGSAEGYVGPVRQRITDGLHVLEGGGEPPATRAFSLTLTRASVRWREAAVLDIQGRMIGPGLQWFTPWPRHGGAFYTARMFRCSGSILGKPVEGFLGFDQYYFPPGFAYATDPFVQDLKLSYIVFGNEYDDGEIEVGHAFFGHDRWGAAMINDRDGPIVLTTNVYSEIQGRDDRGCSTRILYRIDDEDWEFVAQPNARMLDFLGSDAINPAQEGSFRRVGETRGVRTWWAWTESVPRHGERRRQLHHPGPIRR